MALTRSDVEKIAHLARLEFSAPELEAFTTTLSDILAFIEQMNDAPTEDITPMAHPQDVALRLRDDQVTATDRREQLQAIAPHTDQGLYLVPKVLE